MGYHYGDRRTSYNGICLWLQKFEDVKRMPTIEKFKYTNSIIEKFIKHRGESVRRNQDGSLNIAKASNLIQSRWKQFKVWYIELREKENENNRPTIRNFE